jgi:hypothetical protein
MDYMKLRELQRSQRHWRQACLAAALTALGLALALFAGAADVNWSRFRGKVKAINGKASTVTIQNAEGDLVTVKVDDDVSIVSGKQVKALGDLAIDEKVVLVYFPKAPAPKEPEETPEGGVYPPARR